MRGASRSLAAAYWKHRYLVLLFVPALAYYGLFHYAPLYGIQIAFKEYAIRRGIWGSPWVGLANFVALFDMRSFREVLANTLIISTYKLVFGFPFPLVFALLLNEIRQGPFKKTVQTISYLPHFISWVVLGGLFLRLLSPSDGPINLLMKRLGANPIYFLADPGWFRAVLVATSIWKETGWSSIVYLAAFSAASPEVHEAAVLDGAGRLARMWHVTLPAAVPIMTVMFIFAVGGVINDDFDQIFNLYNPAVYRVGDVLSTYIYRTGLVRMEYGFATAVGLFKNLIAFALILAANAVTKRVNEYGIW